MASITVPIASFNNGQVVGSITYNSQTLAITKVQVVNNSPLPCTIYVLDTSTGLSASLTVPANTTQSQNISGYSLQQFTDPYDGHTYIGLPGNVEIHCGWPV